MISITKTFPLLVAPILLSGCSLLATLEDAKKFEEVVDDLPNYTDATTEDIPPSGTSEFEGGLLMANDTNEALLADLAASVNFESGSFSGSASEIRLIDTTAESWQDALQAVKKNYTGTADWDGSITGTDVSSSGSGTISADGIDYTFSFTADGKLYLDGEDVLTMGSTSGAIGSLTAEGGESNEFDGGFYAKEM